MKLDYSTMNGLTKETLSQQMWRHSEEPTNLLFSSFLMPTRKWGKHLHVQTALCIPTWCHPCRGGICTVNESTPSVVVPATVGSNLEGGTKFIVFTFYARANFLLHFPHSGRRRRGKEKRGENASSLLSFLTHCGWTMHPNF